MFMLYEQGQLVITELESNLGLLQCPLARPEDAQATLVSLGCCLQMKNNRML